MFKVPDWGNDIPKSDVEVVKLFTNKNKKKTNSSTPNKIKNNLIRRENNSKKKDVKNIKKAKNKENGHINLSKDDHINNRILRRHLKMSSAQSKTTDTTTDRLDTEKTRGKAPLISNKLHNGHDVSNRIKNKSLKKKDRVPKHALNNKDSEVTKNGGFKNKNNIERKQKSLKKQKIQNHKSHDDIEINNVETQNSNTDEPDQILVNAKRKKLNDIIRNDNVEDILFGNKDNNEEKLNNKCTKPSNRNKIQMKKEKIKEILKGVGKRNVIRTSSDKLRERMLERLKAAQFRYLNEKLYTSSGTESQELFKSDPAAFHTYHQGYQLQVKKWPVNPLDLIVKRIQKLPKTHLIADMGCGEAALSKRVPQTVRSFDLVATTPEVEICNMSHTPLLAASMDVVVYCLALMGTDLAQYLLEANRVLKIGGHLLIAEVESRFENVDTFISDVQRLGFSLKKMDKSHQVFFFMEFNKVRDAPAKKGKLPTLSLKPCLYKRR